MPNRNQPPHDKPIPERRTTLDNDVDPDGMDSESEGDELEAGNDESDSSRADNGPDGALDRRPSGQGRTSGTHGAAGSGTTTGNRRG